MYDRKIILPKDQNCLLNKCQHNSSCTPIPKQDRSLSHKSQKYKCHCQFGFIGSLCETDTRACFASGAGHSPCRNNATCVQSYQDPAEFECICHAGWRGKMCEQNVLCENVTCLNSGQCIDGKCVCGNYFSGDFCEIKADGLVVLERFSQGVSVLAIGCLLFYVILLVTLDALKYIFHVEPSGLDEHRRQMHYKYEMKKIEREKAMLVKRAERLNRSINRIKDYKFHYLRWRTMRFIDESSSNTSGGYSEKLGSELSSFSIQKL